MNFRRRLYCTFLRLSDQIQAIKSYSEAINHLPLPDCIYKINPLLINNRDFKTVLQITGLGIDNSPYDNILILYKTYALLQLRQRIKAFKVLKEHKGALKSFIGTRKLKKMRRSIFLLMPLVLLNINLSSKIIIKLIDILKKNARFD
jgi:hypothetical protein